MLHFRGKDIQCIYRHIKTLEWWDTERKNFALYTSRVSNDELLRGVYKQLLQEFNDALQMALAVVNEVDYLLSWNYAHMANPNVQRGLETFNHKRGLKVPLLVTPESIPQRRLGEF